MLELVRGNDCGWALPCDLAMPVGVCAGLIEGNALREVRKGLEGQFSG